jgi:hypothetical protein
VIFNSSFHYSENYEKTMAEALRCTRENGTVLIADSPWYSDEQSGLRMLEERRALFIKRYGFPSDGLSSLEYLTDQRLASLESRFGIQWQIHEPYYGYAGRCGPGWRNYNASANRPASESTPPRPSNDYPLPSPRHQASQLQAPAGGACACGGAGRP